MRLVRRSTRRLAPLLALGLVLPMTAAWVAPEPAAAAAPSGVRATVGGYPVWAHFADPAANNGRDKTIIQEVQRLIEAAPAGSTIRGTLHSLSVQPVATALVAAEARGVRLAILVDGKNLPSTATAMAILKQLQPTSYKFCTYPPQAYGSTRRAGNACISTSDAGDLHTKMFTFSQTTDPTGTLRSNVSWFGSANMTYASGSDQSNNAVTVYGDPALAAGLNANFTDLWNRRHYPGDDYYDAATGRGYYLARSASVYASPERGGQTDTIATRVNDVTPNSRCQLRIGMNFVTDARPALTGLLTKMRAKQCQVFMVVGGGAKGIEMPRATYQKLIKAGVSLRRTPKVHDKFFLAYGKFGSDYQYKVYTGSQNWSGSALTSNDEIFVKMAPEVGSSHPLYDGFNQHFGQIWSRGKVCTKANYPCR